MGECVIHRSLTFLLLLLLLLLLLESDEFVGVVMDSSRSRGDGGDDGDEGGWRRA